MPTDDILFDMVLAIVLVIALGLASCNSRDHCRCCPEELVGE